MNATKPFSMNVQQPAVRILIADDHQLLADACKGMLEPEFAVVGVVADGRTLIDAAFTLKPDVIILDISMPMLNGLDAGERIKREIPMTPLVFLSMSMSSDVVADAFLQGSFSLRDETISRNGIGACGWPEKSYEENGICPLSLPGKH